MTIRFRRSGTAYKQLRHIRARVNKIRKRLRHVDSTTYIHSSARVATDLRTGPYVFIGRHCSIPPMVDIGRYTMLASDVSIVGADHNWTTSGIPMQFAGRPPQHETSIGADVWIGHGVIVMRGVTIGHGAIAAAGAVITKSIPSCELWGGVPARKIRDRFENPAEREEHLRMLEGPLCVPTFVDPLSKTRHPS